MIKVYSSTPLNKPIRYTIFSNPIGLTGLVATSNGLLLIINNLKNFKRWISNSYNSTYTKIDKFIVIKKKKYSEC